MPIPQHLRMKFHDGLFHVRDLRPGDMQDPDVARAINAIAIAAYERVTGRKSDGLIYMRDPQPQSPAAGRARMRDAALDVAVPFAARDWSGSGAALGMNDALDRHRTGDTRDAAMPGAGDWNDSGSPRALAEALRQRRENGQ